MSQRFNSKFPVNGFRFQWLIPLLHAFGLALVVRLPLASKVHSCALCSLSLVQFRISRPSDAPPAMSLHHSPYITLLRPQSFGLGAILLAMDQDGHPSVARYAVLLVLFS